MDSFDRMGPYRVIRQIGSGGMGGIFEAVEPRLDQRVALKRLHPHIAAKPGATERFLREGRAAARIRHPHVVQVFALGESSAGPYLAMELLHGQDLAATLARTGRLAVQDALELLLPVLAAVAAAHDAGVIHRDLKPSNVFVARGPAGRAWPKVVDFGVSKVLGVDGVGVSTATDAVVGTAAYMAPEQARSVRNASFQSDQYALGVILYQCLTGAPPFAGASEYELVLSVMTAPVAAPSERAAGLPAGLDAVVLRAMHRDPARRFPSVRAFGAALLPMASERDRATWSAELADPGAASSTVASILRAEAGAEAAMETPATMPPTARDTRVTLRSRRAATRALAGLVAAIAVAAVAAAWGDRQRAMPSVVLRAATASDDPTGRAAGARTPVESVAVVASAPAQSAATSVPAVALASTGPPQPREPSVAPPRPTPIHGRPAVAPSTAPPPAVGDNGSPILP